jgi:hypothetical protein
MPIRKLPTEVGEVDCQERMMSHTMRKDIIYMV